MIFRLCLGVVCIVPYDEEKGEIPCVALLSVNKQIRAEARPILYGINCWLLDTVPIHTSPFNIVEPNLFEKIDIAFGGDDLPYLDRLSMASSMHEPNFDFGYSVPLTEDEKNSERMLHIHQMCIAQIFQAWNEKVDMLKTMKNLRSVGVDLEELFCPTGCCRIGLLDETPVRRLLKYLSESDEPFVHGRPLVVFEGLRGEKEENIIYNEYGFRDVIKEYYESKAQQKKSSGEIGDSEQVGN